MSEKSAPDPVATARSIAELAERAGLAPDDVLRVDGPHGLSYAAGLPEDDVRALLRGKAVPPAVPGGLADAVETRHRQVVDRILFLRRTRLRSTPDGQRRAFSLAEIAVGAGTSAQWLDKMIKTGKAPNLDHAAGIAGFFGEGIEFLVATPAEALERVLQGIRKDLLERIVASQDADLQRLRDNQQRGARLKSEDLGVVAYAARALEDVPDDTAQPLIALIESVARRARDERDRERERELRAAHDQSGGPVV